MFRALTTREIVPYERVFAVIAKGEETVGEHLISTILCRLRKKTAPFGVVIETAWGVGLRLHDRERWARVLV